MNVAFPERADYLEHYQRDKLDDRAREWFDLMSYYFHFINLATYHFTDPITKNQQTVQFSSFLKELNTVYSQMCEEPLLFDEYLFVADMCARPLKAIVQNPSSKIVKKEEKVPIQRLRATGPKTTQWLAGRPGRNVREKIAPENKVLTSMTYFTMQTIENEMSMYLHNAISHIVNPRLKESRCAVCEKRGISCKELAEKLQGTVGLSDQIKRSDLKDVKRVKHTVKNNKLMCDKYYKVVWDATEKLSRTEKHNRDVWNHLEENYSQLIFWLLGGYICSFENTYIVDEIGKIDYTESGLVRFMSEGGYGNEEMTFYQYAEDGADSISEIRLIRKDFQVQICVTDHGFTKLQRLNKGKESEYIVDYSGVRDVLQSVILQPEKKYIINQLVGCLNEYISRLEAETVSGEIG